MNQSKHKSIEKWWTEVVIILNQEQIHGLTEGPEAQKVWASLYAQNYTPMQAFNYLVLGMLD